MTDQLPADFGARCRHGGLARVCEPCELQEIIDAQAAEIAVLKAALRAVSGLLNEMHSYTQGHWPERCDGRTDFCYVSQMVAALSATEAAHA